MATNWIMNFAVVQVTLPGIDSLGWKFWIIWAVICFAFIPITYFFYPETANRYVFELGIKNNTKVLLRTLEDVDRFFATKPGIFIHRNKVAVQLHRPAEYIEADERIARGENLDDDEKLKEHIETKEMV